MIIEDTRLEATKRIYKEDRGIKKLGRNLLEDFHRWQKDNPVSSWEPSFLNRIKHVEAELDEENQRLTWMAQNGIKRMRGEEVWTKYNEWRYSVGTDFGVNLPELPKKDNLPKKHKPTIDVVERETLEEAEEADRKAAEPVTESPHKSRGGRVAGQLRPRMVDFDLDASAITIMKELQGHKLVWINQLASKKGNPVYEEDTVPFDSKQLRVTEYLDGRRVITFSGTLTGVRSFDLNDLVQVR